MGLQTLELRIEESLATITLNHPQVLNAINLAMVGELEQAVRQVRDDPSVRVVVITGAGDKRGQDRRRERLPGEAPAQFQGEVAE